MKKRARRNHSSALKAKVALAAIKGDRTLAQLSEHFDVHASQITIWKDQLVECAAEVFERGSSGKARAPAVDINLDRFCARRRRGCAGRDEETDARSNKETDGGENG